MLLAGLYSSHDTSCCVLKNGEPLVHIELERYIRQKQPKGDAFQILMDEYEDFKEVSHFVEILDNTHMTEKQYPYAYKMMSEITKRNGGQHHVVGHHQAHAANAFFSSNFDDSLIITIDGGGIDEVNGEVKISTATVWTGKGNEIKPFKYFTEDMFNIGSTWNLFTTQVFGLSGGWPKGDQAGSVMAMACMGDPTKYIDHLKKIGFKHHSRWDYSQRMIFEKLVTAGKQGEQEQFNVAAALQQATEMFIFSLVEQVLNITKSKNICLAGGVAHLE